ncbi:hypothetical protein [Microseira sp. BLCC-F43]|jgi:hypothetical protein|uniref:hypothetical protein n=1 Tax=Microseira sp. BLCC-F43 TaxID=3153602 RepID=UPI0035B99DEC
MTSGCINFYGTGARNAVWSCQLRCKPGYKTLGVEQLQALLAIAETGRFRTYARGSDRQSFWVAL